MMKWDYIITMTVVKYKLVIIYIRFYVNSIKRTGRHKSCNHILA